jgi:RNA polymerase sigma factor (sigma-70 family)
MDTSFLSHDADHLIIGNLRQGGIERRRGEDALFSKFSYFIKEGMKKHGLSEESAFNAYSDTILAAVERIGNGTFENRSSLKTYLFQIFHNKCVDLIRQNATNKNSIYRTESISERILHLSDQARSIVQTLIDKSDWKLLKEKLSQLGEDCRNMLILWSDGFSDKEIALEMKYKTADVAKTSRLRCLDKLRRLYK